MTRVHLIESAREPRHQHVGIASDLNIRVRDHKSGRSLHTAKHRPWNPVAYFAFADEKTAFGFERYLKTGSGKASLHKRLLRPPRHSTDAPHV
ncbi:MAG: GIY-YIG nuclease family protein [Opitutae bacterium]|nr:GIY-YIG nuclease family protein [Opitutae bacterium]